MTTVQEPRLLRCSSCGATNRVSPDALHSGKKVICGRCKQPLTAAPSLEPLTATDDNFATEVLQAPLPVLVDFWAPWCGPCRMVGPIVDKLAGELAGRVKVAKLNVDENPVTSSQFRAQSIPMLMLFKSGREVSRLIGAHAAEEIRRWVLESALRR